MKSDDVRLRSLQEARRLGYPVNPRLPLLDYNKLRSVREVGSRLLALYAVVSTSYGFKKSDALIWLAREGLDGSLSESEQDFLAHNSTGAQSLAMQWKVEALWALAWAASCHDQLDFGDSCADGFVSLLPNIKSGAGTQHFLAGLKMRGLEEVLGKCDLAYCLHWGAREAALTGTSLPPGAVPLNVILERRRALEWLLGDQAWDHVSLDT
jgi:hypothetical protein